MSGEPQRPSDDNRDAWRVYWAAQGMPWRTEPEIDEERQRYLTERRAVKTDSEKSIYPFHDENGSIPLMRADVEWLAATHDVGEPSSSFEGLVLLYRSETGGDSWERRGPDLRGADLNGVDLAGMPLDYVHLDHATLKGAHLDAAQLDGAHLDGANCTGATLRGTHLDSASLRESILVDADLSEAHLFQASLRGADLRRANLRGADLSWAYIVDAQLAGAELTGVRLGETHVAGGMLNGIRLDLDTAADLLGAIVASMPGELPTMDWAALPLASIDWSRLFRVAEDFIAYWQGALEGKYQVYVSPPATLESELVKAYRGLARSYQQLATVWSEYDLADYSAHLVRRADILRQEVLRRGEDPDYLDPDPQL